MSKKPIISIIVAVDEGLAIGKNNQLLFDIPEDLKHFRDITLGHPVIMGEHTYYSIGKALPHRTNIILTRNSNFTAEKCLVAHTLEDAFKTAGKYDTEEIFVIGGGMVYKSSLPYADKLYLTLVEGKHDADVFFPEYKNIFKKVMREESCDNGKFKFKFMELVK
jgi:dihydrofolate reductase